MTVWRPSFLLLLLTSNEFTNCFIACAITQLSDNESTRQGKAGDLIFSWECIKCVSLTRLMVHVASTFFNHDSFSLIHIIPQCRTVHASDLQFDGNRLGDTLLDEPFHNEANQFSASPFIQMNPIVQQSVTHQTSQSIPLDGTRQEIVH